MARLALALRLIGTLSRLAWLAWLARALRLIGTLSRLARPLRLLAGLVLLTTRGSLHVQVLALFTQLAFLAADTAAVQTFLVLGHGGSSLRRNVDAAATRHKLRPAVGGPALSPLARASSQALVLRQAIA